MIATMMSVPIFGGNWRGFVSGVSSGYLVPMYAAFPIGYLELTRVMMKANLIRIAVWLPLLMAGAVAIAVRFRETPTSGIQLALEIGLTMVLLQLPMIAGRCAAGTNVNRDMNPHTLAFFFIGLVLGCAFIGSTIFFFVSESELKLYAPLAMLISGGLIWAMYGWMHSRGRLDVLSAPQNLQ
jgi:peptidoglycan/LPS O-acetylase OafA/YrhL